DEPIIDAGSSAPSADAHGNELKPRPVGTLPPPPAPPPDSSDLLDAADAPFPPPPQSNREKPKPSLGVANASPPSESQTSARDPVRTATLDEKHTATLEEKRTATLEEKRTAALDEERTATLDEERTGNSTSEPAPSTHGEANVKTDGGSARPSNDGAQLLDGPQLPDVPRRDSEGFNRRERDSRPSTGGIQRTGHPVRD